MGSVIRWQWWRVVLSLPGRLRKTLQGPKRWNGTSEAHPAVFRWATRYNTRRRHSRLGQISPITHEQRSTTLTAAA
ncbi:integrase core domain-containing protein [Streptomyces sp. NBC_01261]|uniref:integrase core domain-containing protein n=1 Tax=Streptomyces sp. NBC_01261 TaxID=2903802 RepID=UPI002E379909|nr:integrase core domain-containing protein [Streptomyces sp. NBC_01261]